MKRSSARPRTKGSSSSVLCSTPHPTSLGCSPQCTTTPHYTWSSSTYLAGPYSISSKPKRAEGWRKSLRACGLPRRYRPSHGYMISASPIGSSMFACLRSAARCDAQRHQAQQSPPRRDRSRQAHRLRQLRSFRRCRADARAVQAGLELLLHAGRDSEPRQSLCGRPASHLLTGRLYSTRDPARTSERH